MRSLHLKSSKLYKTKKTIQEQEFQISKQDLNQIRIRTPNEDPLHITLKSLICLIIAKRGRVFATEVPMSDGHIVDVLDINEKTGYEVQKVVSRQWHEQILKYPLNIIPVYSNNYVSDDIKMIFDKLDAVIP